MNKYLFAILAVVSAALISFGSIYLYIKLTSNLNPKTEVTSTKREGSADQNQTTSENTDGALLSGQLARLDTDLGLNPLSPMDIENGVQPSIYYSAGIYQSGDYKDYTRIIAIQQAMGPGGPRVNVLVTKDFKSYILDGNKFAAENFALDNYNNPLNGFDKTKISKVVQIESDHPISIDLDRDFSLYKLSIVTTSTTTGPKNDYIDVLLTDITDYKTSTLSKPNLTFYTEKNKNTEGDYNEFIDSSTTFFVKDTTGLVYKYDLAFNSQISDYKTSYQKYLEDMIEYEKALKKNPGDQNLKYPPYVSTPSVNFSSTNVVTKENLYKKYSVALPHACGMDTATKVLKGITDADLVALGKIGEITIFKFKNSNHALLKEEFESKINYDKTFFKEVNKIDPPTYAEYISKNPLLVMKDALGRYIAVGEYDYLMPGGCGKPVVYLYPEVPTNISVKFEVPINFANSIPTYNQNNGWEVLANPDGELQNKNNTTENCTKTNNGFGYEYAFQSCVDNSYPYLYWSGTSIAKQYPEIENGWVVEKTELENFLNEKLSYIGLNKNEINDFTSYWLYMMMKKDSPYYKITFLQNKELNYLIPMTVNPMPNTSIRVFMDWKPLDANMKTEPQVLIPMKRDGFTLVEWGGLKF